MEGNKSIGQYLKMTGNILLYGGIYLLSSVLTGVIFAISIVVANLDKVGDTVFIQEAIAEQTQLILVISGVLSILLYTFVMWLKKKNIIKYCDFSSPGLVNTGVLIIAAVSFTTLSTVVMDLTKFYQYFPDTVRKMGELVIGNSFITSLFIIGILIPIVEEILFRGLIFNELKKNINIWLAIIIQALIFAAFHMNLLQGVVTFFMGIVMALVYVWVKSIWAPIIIHIVNNSISVISSYYLPATFEINMTYGILAIAIALILGLLSLKVIRKRSNITLSNIS